MATVQVAKVSGAAGSRVQVTAVRGLASNPGTVQVARVAGSTTTTSGSTVQVAKVSGLSVLSTGLQANAGVPQTVNGNTTVSLDGTGSTGAITVASWTQVSGQAVTINPSGGRVASYTAPCSPTGATLVFRLTVSDGSQISTATVTHTVYPWTVFILSDSGTTLRPVIEYILT